MIMNLRAFFRWLAERLATRPLRFAKYRPAGRLGNRRVEDRLLRRFAWPQTETAR